jgi:predicted transcriptional regulator
MGPKIINVIKSISNAKSIELFGFIALTKQDTDILISKTKLTRKQYYSRMSSLSKAGLVKRKDGKYTLTTFGKVIYDSIATMENAINYYWKLKAIDSLEISKDIPAEERKKILDNLIGDQHIVAVVESNFQTNADTPIRNIGAIIAGRI